MYCKLLIDSKNNEKIIWPLLIEKAFAKEYGGYSHLNGGAIDYALMIMTGKPAFRYNLLNEEIRFRIVDDSFWIRIVEFARKGFLLGGGTLPENEIQGDYKIIAGQHAYAILDAFELDGNKILELRDPRGTLTWTGDWSIGSKKWNSRLIEMVLQRNRDHSRKSLINYGEKQALMEDENLRKTLNNEGSFYISWKEFIECFEVLFVGVFFDDHWNYITILDEWDKNHAGGSVLYLNTVKNNPQYLLHVPDRKSVV